MSLEKIGDPREIRHWMGHMECDYSYTYGVAGEVFFKKIKENAEIIGTKCKNCGLIYVPPRLFCERCFERLNEWVKVGKRGKVHTYTISYIDVDGSKLKKPIIWAMVNIYNVHGGFVHKLGEVDPKDICLARNVVVAVSLMEFSPSFYLAKTIQSHHLKGKN